MDDSISRQAAIDALGERPLVWTSDDDYALGERNQYDIDRLAIETVPPAPVREVKRGKWKMNAEWKVWEGFLLTCSVCNKKSIGGNFCPHCGAEMRDLT